MKVPVAGAMRLRGASNAQKLGFVPRKLEWLSAGQGRWEIELAQAELVVSNIGQRKEKQQWQRQDRCWCRA